MPSVLIRGLSEEAVARIDAAAGALGLSRNEYLRRQLESAPSGSAPELTMSDLRRAAEAARDLLDPEVMGAAWR